MPPSCRRTVETLRHLVNDGMGANTLRALASDLAYLETCALVASGQPLPWPAPEALLLKFVAHHLWSLQRRDPPTSSLDIIRANVWATADLLIQDLEWMNPDSGFCTL